MNEFSLDILLEFLYNKFAITIVFCLFGSFVKEYVTCRITGSNGKKGSFNGWKVIISAIFSTILVCVAADYISIALHIEVYMLISVIVGTWGFEILKCIIDKKFISTFFGSISKSITDPILKSAAESASKTLEDDKEKKKEKEKESNDKDKNKSDTQTIKIEITK